MSQQGGILCMRPLRGLGGYSASGGRSHREERRKASPCFPMKGDPYSITREKEFRKSWPKRLIHKRKMHQMNSGGGSC